jgi:hypothetical protein
MQSFLKIFFKPHSIICRQTICIRLPAVATGLRPVLLTTTAYMQTRGHAGHAFLHPFYKNTFS